MTVTDEQVLDQQLDREMLERPHLWPTVVRGHRCVFLKRCDARVDQTGPCYKIGSGYIVIAHDWNDEGRVAPVTYNSVDAVLSAGWTVD